MTSSWHVVQTQPRREHRAAEELRRQGFEVFVPTYRRRRSHARRISIAPAALFPGYLFVALAPSQPWRAINGTIGIVRIITSGDAPAPIAGDVVEGLMVRRDVDGFVTLHHGNDFAPGDRVRVCSGTFEDALGLYEGLRDLDRVAILLDILGRKVCVTLPLDTIASAA
ncbi:MAG: transcriptional activator RfaH [Gammaproteobacteria bacterium]|nr:transcriptional activator RfaH [Gammaproteobacteria bacterium]